MTTTHSAPSALTLVTKEKAESRLHDLLKEQPGVTETFNRVRAMEIMDTVLPIGKAGNGNRPEVAYDDGANRVAIVYGDRPRYLHDNAAFQLGERLDIPGTWVRESLKSPQPWRRELIATTLQTTIQNHGERSRMLFRSVGNEVRAALSDKYRRLDSTLMAEAFAGALEKVQAVPYRASADDLRWSVSALLPRVMEVRMPDGRVDYTVVAAKLRTSDFGVGQLELALEILRLICVNGAVAMSSLKQVHLGRALPDDVTFSETTYALDSRTQASAIKDAVTQLMTEQSVTKAITSANAAAAEVIGDDAVTKMVKARRISVAESEALNQVLVGGDESKVPGGPMTRWKMAQGLSYIAKAADPDRAEGLERMAGDLIWTASN